MAVLEDAVWGELQPREQARVLRLLIETMTYDAGKGTVDIAFRAGGVRALAAQAGIRPCEGERG